MRILISIFIILAFVVLCPVVGFVIALALLGSIILFPVVLAIRAAQLVLKPIVIIFEMILVKAEKIFVRVYDEAFHRHGALDH